MSMPLTLWDTDLGNVLMETPDERYMARHIRDLLNDRIQTADALSLRVGVRELSGSELITWVRETIGPSLC
jgi:hypothetical protein